MKSKNSIKNFLSSYFIYFILVLLGIYKVRIFLGELGQDLYALNQLYINLYSYLAVAEGGIGMALIYRLYPRFASKQHDEINELYSGTRIIYRYVGLFILVAGFIFTFFIPSLLKDNTISHAYISLTFMMFVVRSALDYFTVVPKLIIQADQKMYKVNMMIFGSRFVIILSEIALIMSGYDYVYSLIPGIILTVVVNLFINRFIHKSYPWLKTVPKRDYSTFNDTKHLLLHKGLTLITRNIDIILIAYFLGSLSVTIYAAYNYFVKFALDSFEHIFNAVKDGMGMVFHEDSKNKTSILEEYFSIFNFIAIFGITLFYLNINKFITLWIGAEYVTDTLTQYLFLVLVYVSTLRQSYELTKTALGRFKETKLIATIQAILNIILSLIFVTLYGMKGVLLGTIISFLLTDFWYYPIYIYTKVLNHNVWIYYRDQVLNGVTLAFILLSSNWLLSMIFTAQSFTLLSWMIYAICSLLITALLSCGSSVLIFSPFSRMFNKALKVVMKH